METILSIAGKPGLYKINSSLKFEYIATQP